MPIITPARALGDSPAGLESLDQLERRHVTRVLKATGGNKTKAAEILGVSRPRLNRMLAIREAPTVEPAVVVGVLARVGELGH